MAGDEDKNRVQNGEPDRVKKERERQREKEGDSDSFREDGRRRNIVNSTTSTEGLSWVTKGFERGGMELDSGGNARGTRKPLCVSPYNNYLRNCREAARYRVAFDDGYFFDRGRGGRGPIEIVPSFHRILRVSP